METYQPIFDAVKCSIRGGNIGEVIERVAREAFDTSMWQQRLASEFQTVAYEMQRPSVLFRPTISLDGNKWCALYGENLMNGVAGFGDSPALAMEAFDKEWYQRLPARDEAAP